MVHTNNLDNSFQEVGNAPNPTEEKNVADLISLVKADATGNTFGVAVDGDADRFAHIDFGGADISANEFAAITLFFLAMNHGFTGAVGKTVATSNYINEVAKYLESQGKDISLKETAVGFKWFVEMATRDKDPVDFLVAVEESAHAGFKPFLMKSWDDGIANAMIGLWILAETGKSLSEYKKFVDDTIGKQFKYDRKSVKVTPEAKAKVQDLINVTKKSL
jgi:phosphoglucomutase